VGCVRLCGFYYKTVTQKVNPAKQKAILDLFTFSTETQSAVFYHFRFLHISQSFEFKSCMV
jgi:hypothetical protein